MGSQRLTAIPNALIKVLEGLVCAVDEALRALLASNEDPEGLRQSLASKSQDVRERSRRVGAFRAVRTRVAHTFQTSALQPPTLAATPSRDAIQDIGLRLV